MITQETIDEIFSTVRVEEIIGDYVQLKRAGSNLKGLSPFTEEKTPSFMVSPAKQIWKDFSTGKGGNAITFLMELEQYTYPEALRYIAKRYNIEIKETIDQNPEQKEKQAEKESLFLVNEYANKFFQQQLWDTEEGKNIGLSYFKEREFTEETIKKFHLGYSPDSWDALTKSALQNGYKLEFLDKTGLTIVKDDKKFDRFKGRVLFPILSFSGRVLGFGGRILKNNDKAAKYLNSPESEIYHKSNILYGIFHAKQAIIKEDQCYLVEGYTDVISLHQNGIENVVASSGTALTKEQIRLVKRLTNNITILYDGDAAGIKASFRGIDLILEQDMNVRVLLFPDGEDPDSFARKNTVSNLKQFLAENTKDFIQFKTQILLEETKGDPIKKAALIRDIVASIAKIDNLIKREVYIRETSSLLNVREETLFKEIAQLDKGKTAEENRPRPTGQPTMEAVRPQPKPTLVDSANELENRIVELLLTYGDQTITITDLDEKGEEAKFEVVVAEEIINQLGADDMEPKIPHHKKIYELFAEGLQQGEIRTIDFFHKMIDDEVQQRVSDVLSERYTLHDWKRNDVHVTPIESVIPAMVTEAIYRYKFLRVIEKENELLQNLQADENHTEIMQQLIMMQQIRIKLAEKLNRPI